MNTHGSRVFVMATATDDPRPASLHKTLQEYFRTTERSTIGMDESSPTSKPRSAVIINVGIKTTGTMWKGWKTLETTSKGWQVT